MIRHVEGERERGGWKKRGEEDGAERRRVARMQNARRKKWMGVWWDARVYAKILVFGRPPRFLLLFLPFFFSFPRRVLDPGQPPVARSSLVSSPPPTLNLQFNEPLVPQSTRTRADPLAISRDARVA